VSVVHGTNEAGPCDCGAAENCLGRDKLREEIERAVWNTRNPLLPVQLEAVMAMVQPLIRRLEGDCIGLSEEQGELRDAVDLLSSDLNAAERTIVSLTHRMEQTEIDAQKTSDALSRVRALTLNEPGYAMVTVKDLLRALGGEEK